MPLQVVAKLREDSGMSQIAKMLPSEQATEGPFQSMVWFNVVVTAFIQVSQNG